MNLQYIFGKLVRKFILVPTLKECNINKTSRIGSLSSLYKVTMDAWSYVGDNTNISYTDIGKYTSISSFCSIGGGAHPITWVSTSPVFTNHRSILRKVFFPNDFNPYKKTKIGNDVWIGAHTCIKSGVNIADGAIIGMGSIVTKNVGPYEIWAGNPAKKIRARFDEDNIMFLLNTEWWNWDEERLKKAGGSFPNIEKFKSKEL